MPPCTICDRPDACLYNGSSGPGILQIVAIHELLTEAIKLKEGGGSARKVKKDAKLGWEALCILTDPEWLFWLNVTKVTFSEIIQPLFKDVMGGADNSKGQNIPKFAAGLWEEYVEKSKGLVIDGKLDEEKFADALRILPQVILPPPLCALLLLSPV